MRSKLVTGSAGQAVGSWSIPTKLLARGVDDQPGPARLWIRLDRPLHVPRQTLQFTLMRLGWLWRAASRYRTDGSGSTSDRVFAVGHQREGSAHRRHRVSRIRRATKGGVPPRWSWVTWRLSSKRPASDFFREIFPGTAERLGSLVRSYAGAVADRVQKGMEDNESGLLTPPTARQPSRAAAPLRLKASAKRSAVGWDGSAAR